jgi:hypothetical protein
MRPLVSFAHIFGPFFQHSGCISILGGSLCLALIGSARRLKCGRPLLNGMACDADNHWHIEHARHVIGLNTLLDEVLDVAVLDVAVLCMGEVRLADVLDFTLPAD